MCITDIFKMGNGFVYNYHYHCITSSNSLKSMTVFKNVNRLQLLLECLKAKAWSQKIFYLLQF